ncbi:ComEC/Rec2 family competence protein [Novosphingobium jiangmenense]|uniref:Competence protein ComEC n=1 Tax=Novosphingobium jiangmenense TaxID=2791981 RepID=A0ABS0HJT1_9SPHN|nr:competence protein ComEC [Novosphingobium jiangmenense]MBF9152519.1 competence protein ComEC [Novosphingobium jiangmenense]
MAVTRIEIDFLPVGKLQKSGDAIAIRYGDEITEKFMVVDGGDLAAGRLLVDHLKVNYGEDVIIDDAVCTHSDGDHASGLRTLIKELPVRRLWVHQPWLHAERLNPQFKGNWTDPNLSGHLRNNCFSVISDLCDLAEEYGVELCEPFAGRLIGPFHVLAPTLDRYLTLVPQMDQTPTAKPIVEAALEAFRTVTTSVYSFFETWDVETLQDPKPDATSVPNESSVVLFGNVGGNRILLTGDAGVGALDEAIYAAGQLGLNITSPTVVQVPHHGSRHNVGPKLLDQILGPRVDDADITRGWAIISAAKLCTKKPYRSVTNALLRRGNCSGGWH